MRLLLVLWALPVCAQVTTGAISGFVLDPDGRPIQHAEVSAVQAARGFARKAFTDAAGFYLLPALPPAAYSVTATAEHFQPAASELPLAVNSRVRTDFRLALVGVKESIDVPASPLSIQSESSELGTVL